MRTKFESLLPDGMKISHFIVLNHLILSEGDWSPARLASALQVTRAAITNTLQRLEMRKLITVKTDARDGRGKLVILTKKGRIRRDRCLRNVAPVLKDMQQSLDTDSFSKVLPFLQEVREYLDDNR